MIKITEYVKLQTIINYQPFEGQLHNLTYTPKYSWTLTVANLAIIAPAVLDIWGLKHVLLSRKKSFVDCFFLSSDLCIWLLLSNVQRTWTFFPVDSMTNVHWILALQELYPFFQVFTHGLKSDFSTFSFSLLQKSVSIRTKLCTWGFWGMRNWFEVVSAKYFNWFKRYWHFFEFFPLYTHAFTRQFWFWLSSNTFLHHSTWYSEKTEFVVAVSAEIPYYHSHKPFCFPPKWPQNLS